MAKPNIKALVIDHGEKIALGVFGLIVLGVLGTTSWARYEKTPDELKRNVANARSKISAPENVWPKSEQETYKVVDYNEQSRLLFTPLASIAMGRFDYSTPLYHPLYRKDEPRKEPLFEAVQYLIVSTGLAPLSIQLSPLSDLPSDDAKPAMEEEMASKPNEDDPFAERPTAPNNAAFPAGIAPPSGASAAGHAARSGASGNPAPKLPGAGHNTKSGASGAPGIFSGMPMASTAGTMAADVKVRGVRYIAVRGVFPLAKQIENYKKALHLPHMEAANLVEIADFVLERQVATANPDPWKDAKWEQVSISTAEEVLDECSDLDPYDPVPTALQDPVITMPLPLRLLFQWGPAATHPKIKGWEMKREEIDAENKLVDALTSVAGDGTIEEPTKERRRGMAGKQRDIKSIAKSAAGSSDAASMMKAMAAKMGSAGMPNMAHASPRPSTPSSSMSMPSSMGSGGHGAAMSSMMSSMGAMGSMGPGAGMRPGGSPLDRLVVNTQYLLFRYLDFDVEPGRAYRYRVQLKLRNPNFDLTPEELGSAEPEIAKGDERSTPWSNISNPEVVPSTVNFYLKQVDREPYGEEKVKGNTSKSVAQLSMFDWDTKLGTVINDALNVWAIGAFIGDEKKRETLKLDLPNAILEKDKDFKFSTMNVLLDVDGDVEIEASQHPDLKLAAADKKGFARVGLVPEALVVKESGEIETLDPYSERNEENRWIRQRDAERKGYEVGESKKPAANRLDALVAANGESAAKEKDGKTKKGRSARLAPSSQSMDPGSMMQQMMQQQMQQNQNSSGAAGGRSSKPRASGR